MYLGGVGRSPAHKGMQARRHNRSTVKGGGVVLRMIQQPAHADRQGNGCGKSRFLRLLLERRSVYDAATGASATLALVQFAGEWLD